MHLTTRLLQVTDVRNSVLEQISGRGRSPVPKGCSPNRWNAMHKGLRRFVDREDLLENRDIELAT